MKVFRLLLFVGVFRDKFGKSEIKVISYRYWVDGISISPLDLLSKYLKNLFAKGMERGRWCHGDTGK